MVRSTRVWARCARFTLFSLIQTRSEEGIFEYRWRLVREVWLDGYRSGLIMTRVAISLRGARKLKIRKPHSGARSVAVYIMW